MMLAKKKLRLFALGGAVVLALGVAGTVIASAGAPATPFKACANVKSVLSVEVNGKCPRGTHAVALGARGATGAKGAPGPVGATGATGPAGASGSSAGGGSPGATGPEGPVGPTGANGSSILTSSGSPAGSCVTGNTDVDLTSGEVFTCTSSAWVDTGSSLQGASGVAYDCAASPYPGIDLANCNLGGQDLFGVSLTGANLTASNLSQSNLINADLVGANLTDANLVGADLNGADLSDANLSGANLTGQIFNGSIVTGVITTSSTTCTDGFPGPCIGINLTS